MYSSYYKVLTDSDANAVVAYLRSVRPRKNKVPTPLYKIALTAQPYPDADRKFSEEEMRDPVMRGRYLGTLGHCMECHSGRIGPAADHVNGLGKGGRLYSSDVIKGYPADWRESIASNITPDPVAGIGAWSDAEIKRAMTQGVARDGRKLKPTMAYSSYAGMTNEDLDAVVAWLRSIPPRR
jgi:mono/diheme cytochrome c family protein